MQLYGILRRNGWRTGADLEAAAARSTEVGDKDGSGVRWIRSYVLAEESGEVGTFCVYQADSPEAIQTHADNAELPVDEIIPIGDTVLVRPDPEPTRPRADEPVVELRPWTSEVRSSAARPNGRDCRRRSSAQRRARARCCSSPVRQGSGRPGSPKRWQRLLGDWSCGGRRAAMPSRPTGRSSRPCVRTCAPSRRASTPAGPLRPHLALLLPELGEPAAATDRATLFEAVRCALAEVAADDLALLVLDDLHWSDEATIELLAALAEPLREMPVAVLAAYRSDGLPRDHLLRWLRNELRRGGNLEETVLAPLGLDETGELLGDLLPKAPSPALVRALHARTQGVPFFVEEMAGALQASGRLQPGSRGLDLGGDEVPVPDTVRDAVLMSARRLSDEARAAAEAAAVAGQAFDLQRRRAARDRRAARRADPRRLAARGGDGRGAFRHALSREALYADVPWLRRRALHRQVAELLEAAGGQSMEIATHWLGARDAGPGPRGARPGGRGVRGRSRVPRCRGRRPRRRSRLWPGGEDSDARIDLLERYARCAELAGDLAEAVKAWRELAGIRSGEGESLDFAEAQRRLAAVYELQASASPRSRHARRPCEAFAANGALGRRRDRAARDGEPPAQRRQVPRGDRARRGSGRGCGEGRPPRPQRPFARPPGRGPRSARRLRRGLELVRGGLALALEHDLAGCGGALPAPRHGALRLGRLPPRRGGARRGPGPVPGRSATRAPRSRASPASSTSCASAGNGREQPS